MTFPILLFAAVLSAATSQSSPATQSSATPAAQTQSSSASPAQTNNTDSQPASASTPHSASSQSQARGSSSAVNATSQPVSGPLSLAASTKKRILEVRIGATAVHRYTVAVGTKAHPTPNGRFTIRHIVWNPAWVPPNAAWAKGKKPTPPGHPKNPMKVVKIFFQEPDYYIHGTGDEDTLGSAASHGCIRMSQEDVFALGRYLMDHAGAPKSADWYNGVFSRGVSADVHLPVAVPIVIGP